jgi:lipopolysaccharide transport system ATP-binding protein
MPEPIISVEGLGKKYRLRQQSAARYSAMRDVIAGFLRGPRRRAIAGDGGQQDFWALQDVSFSIVPGEVTGIIGRNGAGKSTLLKILSQIVEPSTGSVRLEGRIASLLEVGTGFHPELSGRENVFLNGAILGMGRREIVRKFDEIVAFAEVERFLDTPVKHYSSGMYVRLAFAVAAHLEPEILVIDEVLAVGDADFQKKCLGKMEDVSKGGRTVLFVSHNMAAVSALCSRGIVLEKGRVAFDGGVDEALALYSSSSSKDLASAPRDPGAPRILSVRVDDKAAVNGAIRLVLNFESESELAQPHLGVVVSASNGVPVFGFNTDMDAQFQARSARSGEFELLIEAPPLQTGLYKVALWLGEKGGAMLHIDDAILFHFVAPVSVPAGVSLEYIGFTRVEGRFAQR